MSSLKEATQALLARIELEKDLELERSIMSSVAQKQKLIVTFCSLAYGNCKDILYPMF